MRVSRISTHDDLSAFRGLVAIPAITTLPGPVSRTRCSCPEGCQSDPQSKKDCRGLRFVKATLSGLGKLTTGLLAGAGISVRAGIPDFRSETGLFQTLKKDHSSLSSGKDLFDASVFNVSAVPLFHRGRLRPVGGARRRFTPANVWLHFGFGPPVACSVWRRSSTTMHDTHPPSC